MTQKDEDFYRDVFQAVSDYPNFLQEVAEDEKSEIQRLQQDTGFSRDQINDIIDKFLEPKDVVERIEKSYGGEKGYMEDVQAVELPEYTRHALKYEEEQKYVTAMINLEQRS